jgi:hypothetical protein
MRGWALGVTVWIGVVLPVSAQPVVGGAGGAAAGSAAGPSKRVCVDAEVDGVRALSYDCLSQQLAPTPVAGGPAAPNSAEALATGPSNRTGTFNYSAESIRFGSNWGKSVTPQRPQPPQVVPLSR